MQSKLQMNHDKHIFNNKPNWSLKGANEDNMSKKKSSPENTWSKNQKLKSINETLTITYLLNAVATFYFLYIGL